MDELLANAEGYIHTSPWLALVVVFAGGALTASSPCVIAMIPLLMSFVAGGQRDRPSVPRAFGYSACFVLGL